MHQLTAVLTGSIVTLEPLERRHGEPLWQAAQAPEIWKWLPRLGRDRDYFNGWFEASLESSEGGREGVFATIDQTSGDVIGSTRYLNVRSFDRVLEIGWTWLTPSAWRTGANVEAKLLMMSHAFGPLDCLRVEFKTDARNERSCAALASFAQFEGVMRKHLTMPDVGVRDSAYYSVIDEEWPAVRAGLEQRLAER